jgi:SAM-dependent methyltransferase
VEPARQKFDDLGMPLEDLFGERDRAVSFGTIAQRYDRYRSGYPEEMIDDLVAMGPRTALDVGCGTGKLAAALMNHGVEVLGVDPDERMATLARQRGVPVEIATFEEWDDKGRTFDLITSGHAWHWIEPTVGRKRATQLTAPGGAIARCWNYHVVDHKLLTRFEHAYRQYAPSAQVIGRDPSSRPDAEDPFATLPAFEGATSRTYRWTRAMTAEEWIGLISTFGDHIRLTTDEFNQLTRSLESAMVEYGTVHALGGTYLLLAHRTI